MVVGRGIDVLLLLLLLLFLVPEVVVVVVVVDIRQSGKSCTEYRALGFFSYARLSPSSSLDSLCDAYSSPNSRTAAAAAEPAAGITSSSGSRTPKKLLTIFQEGPTLPAPTSLW